MNTSKSPCSPHALEELLRDRLDQEQQSALEEHLGDCAACRERLEAAAAEAAWWQRARSCLTTLEPTVDAVAHVGADSTDEAGSHGSLYGLEGHLAPSDDPRMLGRLAGYEIAGVIGRGGMGIVLKGLDTALGRYIAIKVLSPQLAASAPARQRFAREAKAAASVVHDHVMAIHAVGEAGGLPYLVMPYVRGPALEKRLERSGALAVEEILRIGMQIAAGLAAAHAQGLVHRDIKPANILLEEGVERVKITDFGLARAGDDASLSRSGVIVGTPQYMSPEQARGEPVDCRSDLFSLGSVLYAMCTGHPPFRAETPYGVLHRINEDTSRSVRELNTAIPAWLAEIIEKLHAKEPSKRFAAAAEVAELLEHCLAHVQQPTAVPLPAALTTGTARPRVRNRKLRLVLGALAVGFLVGGGVFVAGLGKDDDGKGAKSEPASTAKLIADLGNASFAEREKATKELDKIGAPVLDALRKAAQSDDPERGRRARDLVTKIERRLQEKNILGPRRVHLVYKDTPLDDAVADFNKKCGFDVPFREGDPVDRKLTLDTGEVTFWQAFDQFCRKAGLIEAAWGPNAYRRHTDTPPPPAWILGNVVVHQGTPLALPTDNRTAVRVRAVSKKAVFLGKPRAGEILLVLEIMHERDLRWRHIEVKVTNATDDEGRNLRQVVPSAPNLAAEHTLPDRSNDSPAAPPNGGLIPVRLREGASAARSLTEISGTITVRTMGTQSPTVDVPFVLKNVPLP